MKVSLQWLSELWPITRPDELPELLTMLGLEVESVTDLSAPLRGVVVAEIKESKPHVNTEKLSVTKVDAGLLGTLQVVCGAKNYKLGDKVPLATVGTTLPSGVTIQKATLRGAESFGMLCSARELGLSEDASGLLILEAQSTPGDPVARALGLFDSVLEVNVTPNRPDALSHIGVARDVAAKQGGILKVSKPDVVETTEHAKTKIRIRIEDPTKCLRYGARVIEGVSIRSSPQWLARRLEACGIRPINNVVDITNYVMLECGQPLHAFDLDCLSGPEIVVRSAKPGEKLTTLDGKERELDADDLLICDRESPQVLAGVMGGAKSEVTNATTRVLLEAANFLPGTVRRSSKRHALRSESSYRFERGADIEMVPHALDRAAMLMRELANGKTLRGQVDVYPAPKERRRLWLRHSKVEGLLGTAVPQDTARRILTSLGFSPSTRGDRTEWVIPSFRADVEREEDMIEEIARIRGFHEIPAHLPPAPKDLPRQTPAAQVESMLRDVFQAGGFDEVINFTFVSPKELQLLEKPSVFHLMNPLSTDQSVMRTTLVAGLLNNLVRNLHHQVDRLRLFEIGRTFRAPETDQPPPLPSSSAKARLGWGWPARETLCLGGLMFGGRVGRTWSAKDAPVDFFDAKGAIDSALEALQIRNAQYIPGSEPYLHPRASAGVRVGAAEIGSVGVLHPRIARQLELSGEVIVFQLDLDQVAKLAKLAPSYQPLPKYPAVFRDLAVVVSSQLSSEAVRAIIVNAGGAIVEEATLFDVYTGKPIPEGRKNLAFAIRYHARDRTLTDQEVNATHERIVSEVNQKVGGSLRGANT